jgi:hypothetical protein
MSDEAKSQSSIILYQTEDGRTRIQCRFEDETVWLSQALMAELFQKNVRTINEHLANIFEEGELHREATVRKFRIVRREGSREVAREVEHYNLDAIISVGYRVKSQRGTQFRIWATQRRAQRQLHVVRVVRGARSTQGQAWWTGNRHVADAGLAR